MKKSALFSILMVVLVAAIMFNLLPEQTEATITCNQVSNSLVPCGSYLTGGGRPPAACCAGVENLKDLVQTQGDRQDVCRCTQKAVSKTANLKLDAAQNLPQNCRIYFYNVPFYHTDADCHSVP